jgi:hypothetical protein
MLFFQKKGVLKNRQNLGFLNLEDASMALVQAELKRQSSQVLSYKKSKSTHGL